MQAHRAPSRYRTGEDHPPGVAVFCGARPGNDPAYAKDAAQLGRALAERGLRLIFGGGETGLMGAAAAAVQDAGGTLAGIVPQGVFEDGVPHGADHLVTVQSLRERKSLMRANAEIFVALAGGIGTLDELVEATMERQLSQHRKEIILVNTKGCWDPFLAALEDLVTRGFVAEGFPEVLTVVADAEEAAEAIDRILERDHAG